jgi:hypothetical protein
MAPGRSSEAGYAIRRGPGAPAAGAARFAIGLALALATIIGTAVSTGPALRAELRQVTAQRCPSGKGWRFDLTVPSSIVGDGIAGAELYFGIGACTL